MRKFLAIILTGILAVSCFLPGLAVAADNDITITSYSTTPDRVPQGSFWLTLNIKNGSAGAIDQVYLNIGQNSAFYPRTTGSKVQIAVSMVAGETKSLPIELVYDGGSENKLPLKITYEKAGIALEVSEYVGINTIKPVAYTPPPTNTAVYIPRLHLENGAMPTGNAGSNIEIPLTVVNNSNHEAKDVQIMPEFLEGGENVFLFDRLSPAYFIASVRVFEKKPVNMVFKINPGAPEKVYPIKLNFRYNNVFGDPYTSSETIYVRVSNPQATPQLSITGVKSEPAAVLAGQPAELTFTVSNTGTLPTRDIRITLAGFSQDGLTLAAGTDIRLLAGLEGGKEASFTYSLQGDPRMATGSYPLSLKLSYKDGLNNTYSDEQHFFVSVTGQTTQPSSGIKTVPKIIIDRYRASPSIARAGQNFDLLVSFLNTNSVKAVQNIKIFLTVNASTNESGSVFTPVDCSNTFFIDYIAPKGTAEKYLTFYTIPDAPPKNYTITANIEYEDEDGNPFSATELIGISVVQQTRLQASDIMVPPQAFIGQPFSVSLQFYNMGKATLYNLMVSLEGDFQTQDAQYFVGNFETGRSDYYDAMVIPTNPGPMMGNVVFAFDDAAGEHQEIRKPFEFTVQEMMPEQFPSEGGPGGKPIDPGGEFREEGAGNSLGARLVRWARSPVVWAVAVALLGGAAWFIRRRIQRKKGLTLDE